MVKQLIITLTLVVGCAHVSAPVEPILDRLESNITTVFLQADPPTDQELYVCRIVEDGRLACVEFERFILALDAAD